MLLALDDDLLQSIDKLVPPLLGEGIVQEVLCFVKGVRHLGASLFGDSVLEVFRLATGFARDFVLRWGLGPSCALLLTRSAKKLILLVLERGVGVSRAVEVLSVALELALGLTLALVPLLLSLLLLLLSFFVSGARGSGVALAVGHSVHILARFRATASDWETYWADLGSSLGLYRTWLPPGPLT